MRKTMDKRPSANAITFRASLKQFEYPLEAPDGEDNQPSNGNATLNRKRKRPLLEASITSPRKTRSRSSLSAAMSSIPPALPFSSSSAPLPLSSISTATATASITTVTTAVTTATAKPKRHSASYAPPSRYAHLDNKLQDKLAPNLVCLFVGVNPGLRTATSGHAYAHPSNLFWKLLFAAGLTPRACRPADDAALPALCGLGNTNVVARATRDASELSGAEMEAGVAVLEAKVRRWRPRSVAIVGKGIWEAVWRVWMGRKMGKAEFAYGWQERRMGVVGAGEGEEGENGWAGARVFVATTTSGLAAGMGWAEKLEIWKELGVWVNEQREHQAGEAAGSVKAEDDDSVKREDGGSVKTEDGGNVKTEDREQK